MYRARKLRWRRKARQRKQQVEDLSTNAGQNFDRHFSRRLDRLQGVRRFVGGWLFLMALIGSLVVLQTRSLGSYYLHLQPVEGGTYIEGMSGLLTNANPLFVSGVVDSSVSKLMFSGLLNYDQNNKLVADLAESWNIDSAGTKYTVKLRPDLKWHDGKSLTADDVAFTFKLAQNADAKSAYFHAWKDVKIEKINDKTVVFTLKSVFAPFEHSLTTGIIPKHILGDIEPSQIRSASFNTNQPVGSGPFVWDTLEISGNSPEDRQQNIGFSPNENYHFGRPKINNLVIKTFAEDAAMIKAYQEHRIDAMLGLEQIPEELSGQQHIYETPKTAITMAFFNLKEEALKSAELRKALVLTADKQEIYDQLGYPVVPADSPFLRKSFAYMPSLVQPKRVDLGAAQKQLKDGKYSKQPNGLYTKGDKEVSIRIIGKNNFENSVISRQLQQDWLNLGINTEVILQEEQDLQLSVDGRNYDVLLKAISIGAGPDVYAYWHSTQSDPRSVTRLNFSNYSSEVGDSALEIARNRLNIKLRAAKYKPFLEEWMKDSPALALYQPRFLYISRVKLFNYNPTSVNVSADRFNNVHNWMIRQDNVRILEK